jgi:hypothetical protein
MKEMHFSTKYILVFVFGMNILISGSLGLSISSSISSGQSSGTISITSKFNSEDFLNCFAALSPEGTGSVDLQSDGSVILSNEASTPTCHAIVKLELINPTDVPNSLGGGWDASDPNHAIAWTDPSVYSKADSIVATAQADNADGDNALVKTSVSKGSLDFMGFAEALSGSNHRATASETVNSAMGESIRIDWDASNINKRKVDGYATISNGVIGPLTNVNTESTLNYAEANVDVYAFNAKSYKIFSEARKGLYSRSSSTSMGSAFKSLNAIVDSQATATALKNKVATAVKR